MGLGPSDCQSLHGLQPTLAPARRVLLVFLLVGGQGHQVLSGEEGQQGVGVGLVGRGF